MEIQDSELEALGAQEVEFEPPEIQLPESEDQEAQEPPQEAKSDTAVSDSQALDESLAQQVQVEEISTQPSESGCPDWGDNGQEEGADGNLDLLLDVPLRVTVELGRAEMPIREVLALRPGSVVELSKVAGEAVDILVNGKLIAHGEVVVIDDMFGVRVTDIIPPSARVRSLS